MDKDRKLIIDRRAKGRAAATGKDKGKYTEESAAAVTFPLEKTPMHLPNVPRCCLFFFVIF